IRFFECLAGTLRHGDVGRSFGIGTRTPPFRLRLPGPIFLIGKLSFRLLLPFWLGRRNAVGIFPGLV
ncbi:MAG: hypothetical protein ABDK94_10830, partial [Atribacterota bacterium]